MDDKKKITFKDVLLSAATAVLLILSFPKTDFYWLAWFAFIPLLKAIEDKKNLQSLALSYFTGIIFFTGTIYWFVHVTVPGAVLLILYCAVYFGLFGFIAPALQRHSYIKQIFFLPSLWVVCEYLRAHLLSGFGWVSLGHSQYKNLFLIQIADLTGVAGISFLVFMSSVVFKNMLFVSRNKQTRRAAFIFCCIIVFVFIYGRYRLVGLEKNNRSVHIAVVQGNVDQDTKWQPSQWPAIMKKYLDLTKEASLSAPDLIVWPETSLPGFWPDEKGFMFSLRKTVIEIQTPVLFGSVLEENGRYYNAAILFDKKAENVQVYRKLHLVPFGEYIPLRKYFPFLEEIVPIADFTSGKEYTLFNAGDAQKIGVLICFEDTLEYLARGFAQNGAELFINMTNDAWFKDTKAPFIHLQTAVFQAVENRKSLVRAANTGVSCSINAFGKINGCVEDSLKKKTYVAGVRTFKVGLHRTETLYTRFGDVFVLLVLLCLLGGFCGKKKTILS